MRMQRFIRSSLVELAAIGVAVSGAVAQPKAADRLYIMDCGHNAAADQSRWSPGVNVGKPIELSDNCYLIRHGSEWLLWDTGYPDAVADKAVPTPVGTATRAQDAGRAARRGRRQAVGHPLGGGVAHARRPRRQRRPVPAVDAAHPEGEFDWAFAPDKKPPFKAERPIRKLEGDLDVFGDGSVTIISTEGHAPGHQSLLVHLPKTGWIVLSGDAAHFKDNWDNRRVASMNTSAEQTQASFKRIADLMAEKNAQLWINHDKPQSLSQKHSPAFYD